jgi:hypothetical protein
MSLRALRPASAGVLALACVACGAKATQTEPVTPADTGIVRGFALSPLGLPADYSATPAFFAEVGALGRAAVMWNGAWRDDAVGGSDAGTLPGGAAGVLDGAAQLSLTPVLVFGWRSGTTLLLRMPTDSTDDWSDTEAATAYRSMIAAMAAQRHPPYVFLGNENDFYSHAPAG